MLPMLHYLQKEMQQRGDLLDQHEVSHISDLQKPPPFIVLCIDEVALLQKEKALMELVEEVSAIGRALGVFLILSMQRPDRKVLDGKLKNNLTVRMGFRCADLINSRIIGTPGSEKLKTDGRMLLKMPIDVNDPFTYSTFGVPTSVSNVAYNIYYLTGKHQVTISGNVGTTKGVAYTVSPGTIYFYTN